MSELHASAQRVVDAAAAHGLLIEVVEYPHGARTAVDAANAVGCAVGQIVKSLIFDIEGELVLALTSGDKRVDLDALAHLAGGRGGRRADADAARALTGYAIGGIPPFGHANPVRAFLDSALEAHEIVWAAAGTPRHVFPIEPSKLKLAARAESGHFAVGAEEGG